MAMEFKFRVWDKDNKEMVYFDFSSIDDGSTFAGKNMVDIIDNEVMQYTSLKDKNGKELYDGDILKDNLGRLYEIKWREEFVRFICQPLFTDVWAFGMFNNSLDGIKELEIIGNRFENPELMEAINAKNS
jgi:hypothetical protein